MCELVFRHSSLDPRAAPKVAPRALHIDGIPLGQKAALIEFEIRRKVEMQSALPPLVLLIHERNDALKGVVLLFLLHKIGPRVKIA